MPLILRPGPPLAETAARWELESRHEFLGRGIELQPAVCVVPKSYSLTASKHMLNCPGLRAANFSRRSADAELAKGR